MDNKTTEQRDALHPEYVRQHPEVVTTKDAADMLGVSHRTVQLWVDNGTLKAWRTAGGHRRVLLESVRSVGAGRAAAAVTAPGSPNIVQDVRTLFSECGFEVRDGAGFCELVGSIDAGGVLVEKLIESEASRCRAQGGNTNDSTIGAPVTANKAAEEGELPALPEPYGLLEFESEIPGDLRTVAGYCADDMKEYARQAISADRASRQVANKAEVEPVISSYDLSKVKAEKVKFVDALIHSGVQYRTCGAISATLNRIIDASEVTPPTTTGASTAREAWEYSFTHSSAIGHGNSDIGPCLTYDKAQAFGVGCFGQKRVVVSVGASTVLTDERIEELFRPLMPNLPAKSALRQFARAIEREVAAQAGQVAPADLHDAIRRLPLSKDRADFEEDIDFIAYQEGHRDARRSAAKLAAGVGAGQVAVPEGWKLVPDKPNAAMLKAGAESEDKDFGLIIHNVYIAMLAAAPSAPVVAQQAPADWISVDDQEPPEHELIAARYWPYDNHENAQAVSGARYIDGTFYDDEGDELHPPSHWCRLPPFDAAATAQASTAGERPEQQS